LGANLDGKVWLVFGEAFDAIYEPEFSPFKFVRIGQLAEETCAFSHQLNEAIITPP
jgi:hypothetical protein